MRNSFAILKFQIGPVQDFIAAARSTRDLWSGSYLLSFLVAAGVRKLFEEGGELIFPDPDGQPMLRDDGKNLPVDLSDAKDRLKASGEDFLTPNLPNLFVAKVAGDRAKEIADEVEKAIREQWKAVTDSVIGYYEEATWFDQEKKQLFQHQVDRHLEISWNVTVEEEAYKESFADNGWHLDAIRQTRSFYAWNGGATRTGAEKDSLNGRDEALANGESLKKGEYGYLFKHKSDWLGAVAIVKRLWHLTYLHAELDLTELDIRSIPAIASREKTKDDETAADYEAGEKYIAAIAFDGDSIGKWVSGEKLPADADLKSHHRDFSAALREFALKRARPIVENPETGEFKGFLIYAGGDDVVALVPADAALSTARELREAFVDETAGIQDSENNQPDASAGIAIAHVKAPLQDLIRAAQLAEKRAKNTVDRSAFSVSLMKRSGEITRWGAKWESGAVALYEEIAERLSAEKLSAKFPHRVCQLLAPYVTRNAEIGGQEDAPGFDAVAVILAEFAIAVSRQSTKEFAEENRKALTPLLKSYLEKCADEYPEKERKDSGDSLTQTLLAAVTGLFTTVAFAQRNRPAEKQAAP